ncbi:MAG: RsmE family RNA methyltransferase [bacterium]|nr:RsmE family RNA methyltransferase [bacterium]
MRLNRFFGNFDLKAETIKSSDEELINQLKNVLRLNNGDEIILCDGKLNEASCVIESIGRSEVVFKIVKVWQNKKEFSADIILYCSVLKRENFELVIQKAVELGVKEIVPIIAKRTIKLGLRADRAQKIIKEAAEQSGRGILPILRQEMPFADAVRSAESNDLNLFCELDKKPISDSGIDFSKYKKIGVFIGPEGGWDEEELQVVNNPPSQGSGRASNFKVVGLSPFTLRAETAAIAALSIIQPRTF